MTYAERAASDIMAYLRFIEATKSNPDEFEIAKIIQYHSAEEAYMRLYGAYPNNPRI